MPKDSSVNKSQIFVKIFVRLTQSPHGVHVEDLKKEFNISDRNYRYYLKDLKAISELFDKNGETMVVEEKEGDAKFLRIKPRDTDEEKGDEFYASFFMASALMNFLAGTKLDDPIKHWIKTLESNGLKLRGSHLDKKFYSINEMPKDYSGKQHIIRLVIQALIDQWKVDITYKKTDGETSFHANFKPYTLVQFRFGLYLLGSSEKRKGVTTLSIDRIVEIKRTSGKFSYPADYSPAKYCAQGIGIIRGEGSHVVQLLFDADIVSLVKERQYHATAKFTELKDGSLRMTLTVDSLPQVKSWVLSFGPYVVVEGPKELLDMVKEEVKETAKNYGLIKGK